MHKEICDEVIQLLKTMRDSDFDFTIGEIQLYLTNEDGAILELCVGVDEDGVVGKSFCHYDDMEDLQIARDSQTSENLYDQGLLN